MGPGPDLAQNLLHGSGTGSWPGFYSTSGSWPETVDS